MSLSPGLYCIYTSRYWLLSVMGPNLRQNGGSEKAFVVLLVLNSTFLIYVESTMNFSGGASGFQLKCCDNTIKAEADYSRCNEGPGGRLRRFVYTCRRYVTQFEKSVKTPGKIRKSLYSMQIFLQTHLLFICSSISEQNSHEWSRWNLHVQLVKSQDEVRSVNNISEGCSPQNPS